jgi:hypothetical protein
LGDGLPVGLQILGRAWDDARIVGYAYAYEQATQYRRPPPAVPPLPGSLASRFVGVWKLVAIQEQGRVSGRQTPVAGSPVGQLIYTANGRLSMQILRISKKLAAQAADGSGSYFGRWELLPAEGCIVHYWDGSQNPAQVGHPDRLYYSFDAAGRLALATPPLPGGGQVTTVLVWERLP